MDGGVKKTPTKQLDSLMEHTRLKNIAICCRKLPQNLSISDLVKAINALDTKTISNDTQLEPIPLELKIENPFLNFCVGVGVCDKPYVGYFQRNENLSAFEWLDPQISVGFRPILK